MQPVCTICGGPLNSMTSLSKVPGFEAKKRLGVVGFRFCMVDRRMFVESSHPHSLNKFWRLLL